MTDLLVRDLSDETKRKLAIRAAENGRSQSAEVAAIVEEAVNPPQKSWVLRLYEAAQAMGGVDLDLECPGWQDRTPISDCSVFNDGEAEASADEVVVA